VVLEEEVAVEEGPEGVGDDNVPENISRPKSHESTARPGKRWAGEQRTNTLKVARNRRR